MSFPSTAQLKRALKIRARIEVLEQELDELIGSSSGGLGGRMSASARARIGEAQRARWAKVKGGKRRRMPASAKAKLAAIARARWAKVKAAGKKRL
jgi:hypothetical protein